MKRIYDFARHAPPEIHEKTLRDKLERRKSRRLMALLVLAGILLQTAAVLLGYSAIDWYPIVSIFCFGYGICAATGGCVAAIVYTRKGGGAV